VGSLRAGAALAAGLVLLALVGPAFVPDPSRLDLDATLAPPSTLHPMGTDGLGRDLAARVVHGARVSLAVGVLSAAVSLLLGIPLGTWAGLRGGLADRAVSGTIEALLCFPSLLLVLGMLTLAPPWLAGLPDPIRIGLVLGAVGGAPSARFVRGEVRRLAGRARVQAARAAGSGPLRTAVRHVLPSALAPVLVVAAFAVGGAIGLEAALSFLGLGVSPPTPSWGGLLQEARSHLDRWWLATFPGAALFAAVLGCNLLGEGLRVRLGPRR